VQLKIPLAVLSLLVLLFCTQCSRQPVAPQNPLLGRYALSGYDDSGQLIFTGEISFESIERNTVKGQYKLVKEKNAPEALYDQNSAFEGSIDGKKLSLDLAPSMDDGGMLVDGEFDGGRITGDFLFDSFVGARRFARFEAVKRALG
jgi:hypothetical protein